MWVCRILGCALLSLSLGLAGCGGSATPAPGSPTATPADDLDSLTSEQLVRRMMEVTGAARLADQVMRRTMATLSEMPGLPPQVAERVLQKVKTDELLSRLVPIYLKHYDRETMIAAIRFYQSEHGKKLIGALPAVTEESMRAGEAWGREIGEAVARELISEQSNQTL